MRFREVRNRTLGEFTNRFTAKIAESRERGRIDDGDRRRRRRRAALVALIERMAAFHARPRTDGRRSRPSSIETTARIIHQTVVGPAR